MMNRELLLQLIVFGIVGVTATLTHYFVALFTHELGEVNLYIANLLGYGTAVAVSFFGHGRFTFKHELDWSVFSRFAILSVSTFCTSELMLAVMEQVLELEHRISLAVVVLTIPLITFVFSKLWVFRAA